MEWQTTEIASDRLQMMTGTTQRRTGKNDERRGMTDDGSGSATVPRITALVFAAGKVVGALPTTGNRGIRGKAIERRHVRCMIFMHASFM